jgi:glycosyltransferase involved in cell wall biosynthesis
VAVGPSRDDLGLRGSGAASAARGGRPLRLLVVIDSLEVGGAERHVVDLALALRREGHAVTVACSVSGSLAEPLEASRVPVRPIVGRIVKRRVSLPYAWGLRKLLRSERFDLVHAHVYSSAAASALATAGTGTPLVVTEHTEALWQGRNGRFFSRLMYRRVARVIAVSRAIRSRLIERDGVPPAIITVVPNSAPPSRGSHGDALPIPSELGQGPVVGMVARLQPEKGVTSFLKAAAHVAKEFPQARFVVVGDGPLREELFRLAEDLRVRERVLFLGFRPDAQALIKMMDVVAVPSVSEGTPLVVLEAMAAGVPVVASAVGGIPDQIRPGHEGILVPPGDTDALARALIKVLRDPELAQHMGEAGRLRAGTEFSHENMVRKVEAIYRDALADVKSSE